MARKSVRAGIDCCPRGQDIVNQNHPPPRYVIFPIGRDLERALYVVSTFRPRQADLLLGWPNPLQCFTDQFDAALPLDHPRQRPGLVVAAAPAPPPVQRHRNQRIGLAEQFMAGPCHPATHGRRQIGAVLVFQRMHQRARDIVIAHRRAGALVGRWIGDRLHRQQPGAGIVDKGNAEPRAKRRRDERQFRPAFGADTFAAHRLAAGDAQRRQRDVERKPRGMRPCALRQTQRATQTASESTRG